mgnify:CR=1 FL=1
MCDFYNKTYIKQKIFSKSDRRASLSLLFLLKCCYNINETKETVKAKKRPIVIVTSNAEKELPDAFLRRCIFHYIQFPNKELMEQIIKVHFDNLEETLLQNVLETFYWIRDLSSINKKPSTSEVIDWIQALEIGGIDPEKIKTEIPFAGVLLKKNEDLDALERSRRRFRA